MCKVDPPLVDKQRRVRVERCQFTLREFNGGRSKLTWEVLTGDETWFCRYDPETKMRSAVWPFPDESLPPKLKRPRSAQKKIVACFFGTSGHVAIVPLDDRRTVTADWYGHHCLSKVFEVWCQRRPKTGLGGLFLHQDNASAHTAATTVDFLNESEVQLLPYPPYSPDLSPCDFFLFPELKRQLNGILFESAEEACRAFPRAVEDRPKSTWAEEWKTWFHRMAKCIAAEERFFEKMEQFFVW